MGGSENVVRVTDRIYQSGCPVPRADVEATGVTAILSVARAEQPWVGSWAEDGWPPTPERPQLHIRLRVPLIDASGYLDAAAADAAVAAALRLLGDPRRRLLVHCEAGAFRSVHICACILAHWCGLSGPDAFAYVDRRRGYREPRRGLDLAGWREHLEAVGP